MALKDKKAAAVGQKAEQKAVGQEQTAAVPTNSAGARAAYKAAQEAYAAAQKQLQEAKKAAGVTKDTADVVLEVTVVRYEKGSIEGAPVTQYLRCRSLHEADLMSESILKKTVRSDGKVWTEMPPVDSLPKPKPPQPKAKEGAGE